MELQAAALPAMEYAPGIAGSDGHADAMISDIVFRR